MSTESTVNFIINAEDKTSPGLTSAAAGFEKLGKFIIAALPIAAIEEFARRSVEAAAAAQVKMASFNATMAAVPGVTDAARQSLLSAAEATIKLGFNQEDAAISLGKLYQRTNDASEAIKLNNLAMDLARAKHLDLTTAGNLVGLVMSGNGRILKQYGVDLKEAGTPAQALIELQAKLAGQSEAFSKTFEGQSQVLQQNIEELQKSFGGPLLQVLNAFLTALNNVIEALRAGGLSSENISLDMDKLAKILKEVWDVVANFLKPAFEFFTKQIKDSWDMIKQYSPSIEELNRDFNTLKPFLIALATVFTDVLGAALYIVIKALTLLIIAFENTITFIADFYKLLQGYVNGIVDEFTKVTDAIGSFVNATAKIGGKVGGFVINAIEGKASGGPVSDCGGTARGRGPPRPRHSTPASREAG